MKPLQRLWNDIRRGENIDLYVTVFFAIVLAALNIIGAASQEWLTSLNLALLALLAISILGNRYRLDSIYQKLTQNSEGVLKRKWPEEQLDDELRKADDILLVGVSLSRTIRTNLTLFDQRLQHGASIKVLLVDPSSPAAEIAASRLPVSVNAERTSNDIQNSLSSLESLAKTRSGLEIRILNNPMSFGGIWLNTNTSKGVIYIEQYSFKMQDEDIPKLILRPEDEFWYAFFAKQAQTLWENAESYISHK